MGEHGQEHGSPDGVASEHGQRESANHGAETEPAIGNEEEGFHAAGDDVREVTGADGIGDEHDHHELRAVGSAMIGRTTVIVFSLKRCWRASTTITKPTG